MRVSRTFSLSLSIQDLPYTRSWALHGGCVVWAIPSVKPNPWAHTYASLAGCKAQAPSHASWHASIDAASEFYILRRYHAGDCT
eukprot:365942-Chlamydomonas_euryale.AAC.63